CWGNGGGWAIQGREAQSGTPPPGGGKGHKSPDLSPQRARQMSKRRVDGYHKIETCDNRRGLSKVLQPCRQVGDRAGRKTRDIARPLADLQTEPANAGKIQQRTKLLEANRAVAVVLVGRVATPG